LLQGQWAAHAIRGETTLQLLLHSPGQQRTVKANVIPSTLQSPASQACME
jgi:hypothetical protein